MQVKVLGTGCAKCRALEERVRKVAEQNQIAIELEKVTQIDDLLSYGIMMTPGLVIDGQVKSAGNLPLEKDILAWLKG
ncbi:MAG TPA: thioredoxin family protein [bacterium]|nr:thioredoxin family protein [bacterium]HPG46428.1 thioredoxin family protein [bacterium]HPM98659.1 thioredoxin family protein [bacterium]